MYTSERASPESFMIGMARLLACLPGFFKHFLRVVLAVAAAAAAAAAGRSSGLGAVVMPTAHHPPVQRETKVKKAGESKQEVRRKRT